MALITAGELNARITFRTIEYTRDPLGAPLPGEPVDVATVWAKVEPISNSKIRTLDQQQVVETYRFTCYPRADVAQDWQVVFGDMVFTVRAVDRTKADRLTITGERETRHDRTGN